MAPPNYRHMLILLLLSGAPLRIAGGNVFVLVAYVVYVVFDVRSGKRCMLPFFYRGLSAPCFLQ